MDLVLPYRIETNVAGCCAAIDPECHTVSASRAAILVGVQVETTKIDLLIINHDTSVVPVRTIPTVDLVEIKLEDNMSSITWKVAVVLEGILARTAVNLSVSSKELRESWG